jgi:hypothetical protein
MSWSIVTTGTRMLETDIADDFYDTGVVSAGASVGDVIVVGIAYSGYGQIDVGVSGGTILGSSSSSTGLDTYTTARVYTGSNIYAWADGLELEYEKSAFIFWIILRPTGTATFDKISSFASASATTGITIPAQTVSNASSISVAFVTSEDAFTTRTLSGWDNYTEQLDTHLSASFDSTEYYGAIGTRTGDAESVGSDAVLYSGTQDALKAWVVTVYEAAAAGNTVMGVTATKVNGVSQTKVMGVT